MRAPLTDPHLPLPGPPARVRVYAIRFIDQRGERVTVLRRQRPAALRVARQVEDRGGLAQVFVTDLAEWKPL